MSRPIAIIALLFAATLALPLVPTTNAHGIVFSADPLTFNLDGYLAADKTIQLDAGAVGKVYFAAYQPPSAGIPLDFTLKAPLRMIPMGAEVQVNLVADQLVVSPGDANGNSIRIELLANGTPIPGAKSEQALQSTLQPGSPSGARATLSTNVTVPIDENATLTLRLTPLQPAMIDQSLAVVVGGDGGSVMRLPLFQVPTVQDLHMEDTPLEQYDISRGNFTPKDNTLAVNEIDVYHDSVTTNYVNVFGTKAYLVFKGAEPSNDAQQFHTFVQREKRLNATHDLLVGTTLVRTYPGLGVIVNLDLASGPTVLKCVQNCPKGGFEMTIAPFRVNQKPGDAGAPAPGANIPTVPTNGGSGGPATVPPSTQTTPTPATKSVPAAPLAASLAVVLVLAIALRRRVG